MRYLSIFLLRIAFIYLSSLAFSFGQTATTTATSTISTVSAPESAAPVSQSVTAYQREQQTLANGMATLLASGATPQQMGAWQAQNSIVVAARQQQAVTMANSSASQPMPTPGSPNLPADTSPALKDFLTRQATLAKARAQIHNQLLQQAVASGQNLTTAQTAQVELQETQGFSQQHAGDLKIQAREGQIVTNSSSPMLNGLPSAPLIPPNTSPQMASFLSAKHQLVLSQVQVLNQNANAAPSVQAAAMLQWQQQNASALAQLHQLAASLSSQNPSPQ